MILYNYQEEIQVVNMLAKMGKFYMELLKYGQYRVGWEFWVDMGVKYKALLRALERGGGCFHLLAYTYAHITRVRLYPCGHICACERAFYFLTDSIISLLKKKK